jgi:DNA-binding LytR/AlgR family response regulator
MVLAAFLPSLVLRPVCRSLVQRSPSWTALEVRAAGWSLLMGSSAVVIASRFLIGEPESVELLEACAKTSVILFLWCNLYFSVKQPRYQAQQREPLLAAKAETPEQSGVEYPSRFTVRTGSRIQVVPAEDLAWIAAAGDYPELHTRSNIHLLRETMNSLEQKLDPARFVRIHRSRIVSLGRILELRAIENREYIVKLSDGSEHRSSRTYADRIERWLDSGRLEK